MKCSYPVDGLTITVDLMKPRKLDSLYICFTLGFMAVDELMITIDLAMKMSR